LVVVFFFLIVGVIIGFNAFLQNRPPLTLTLAADPSAQRWASALVEAFNARGRHAEQRRARTVALGCDRNRHQRMAGALWLDVR
jgi:hypothetical protein